ncbi:MAG TPA: MSMEG_0567/Sll0786 family nitrogen starvation N-acetyltransferase, partial [Polyangiales bacterium]
MLEPTRPYGAPIRAFASPSICFELAREAWQERAYWTMRRAIFCDETRLFDSVAAERDEHDERAIAIVAVAHNAGVLEEVVGIVRIYQREAGVWYGGRLGVSSDYRVRPAVGSGLIKTAVGIAKGHGCQRFLATVLRENELYFRRHNFRTLEASELCGRAHASMQADLSRFEAIASS